MPVGDRQKVITEIVSQVLGEPADTRKKFDWFINKHTEEHFGLHYPVIHSIFKSLNGDVVANQSKRTAPLSCDAYFGGRYNFIFEFDEYQHFTSARLRTLNQYPGSLKLNFDISNWVNLCGIHKESADRYRKSKKSVDFNFPGGRTAQRAYLDCFRDLLPANNGLNPTLRINDLEVSDISILDKKAFNLVEQILKQRL